PPTLHVLFPSLGDRSGSAANSRDLLQDPHSALPQPGPHLWQVVKAVAGFSVVYRRSGVLRRPSIEIMMRESLFLCHRLPYPPNKGDKIRSHALLCHLARRGPVHLACFVDEETDFRYLDDVRRLAGGSCHFEPLGKGAKAW